MTYALNLCNLWNSCCQNHMILQKLDSFLQRMEHISVAACSRGFIPPPSLSLSPVIYCLVCLHPSGRRGRGGGDIVWLSFYKVAPMSLSLLCSCNTTAYQEFTVLDTAYQEFTVLVTAYQESTVPQHIKSSLY